MDLDIVLIIIFSHYNIMGLGLSLTIPPLEIEEAVNQDALWFKKSL